MASEEERSDEERPETSQRTFNFSKVTNLAKKFEDPIL